MQNITHKSCECHKKNYLTLTICIEDDRKCMKVINQGEFEDTKGTIRSHWRTGKTGQKKEDNRTEAAANAGYLCLGV